MLKFCYRYTNELNKGSRQDQDAGRTTDRTTTNRGLTELQSPAQKEEETQMFKSLWHDEDGLTTVEYALLLALVAIAAIVAWTTLGTKVNTTVDSASGHLP